MFGRRGRDARYKNVRHAFRYHWVSTMSGGRTVTAQEAALWPPQFLAEEMRQRMARSRCPAS
jgi:hypothetical protein